MNKFTDVYTKARQVVENQQFSADWQNFLVKDCHIKSLLGPNGFDTDHSDATNLIRKKIASTATPGKVSSGEVIYKAADNGGNAGSIAERAATIKMLKHLYRTSKKGGQDVWTYAAPKAYSNWIFDEITGNADAIKNTLSKDEEIFTKKQMEWMSSALGVALKISEDAKVKLANKKKCAKYVKRWFLDEDCGDEELDEAIKKLVAGFNKISVTCNASTLVFADYPNWRAHRDQYFGAAYTGGEGGGFPVIYLEGAFTRLTGNSGKKWLCALTIIHEFSHHDVETSDHRYDHQGLKPNAASFPFAKTIDNADSWAYFALDLAGYLSWSDRRKTLK